MNAQTIAAEYDQTADRLAKQLDAHQVKLEHVAETRKMVQTARAYAALYRSLRGNSNV